MEGTFGGREELRSLEIPGTGTGAWLSPAPAGLCAQPDQGPPLTMCSQWKEECPPPSSQRHSRLCLAARFPTLNTEAQGTVPPLPALPPPARKY
jgi:hypothetical protein